MVEVEPIDAEDRRFLAETIERHRRLSDSKLAERILAGAPWSFECFKKVVPRDYRRVLDATRDAIARGESVDEAVMAAAHG
jgi:glutamate synthase (NADPH) large chain